MKNISANLKQHLQNNNEFVVADLYTISVVHSSWSNGLVITFQNHYFNSGGYDLTYDGKMFQGSGAHIKRDRTRLTMGTEVDTLGVEIMAGADIIIGGLPFVVAAQRGFLDGALFVVDTAFIDPSDKTVIGHVNMFTGRVSNAETTRSKAELTVTSDLELLNISMPRTLYQPACQNDLYDSVCGVDRSVYAKTGTAGSSATTLDIPISGEVNTVAEGYWNLGGIIFTSGILNGTARTVKKHVSGVITVANPLPTAPETGDQLVIYPGCDKTIDTCQNKFSDLDQFRAQPFVPKPEVAV